MNLLSSQRILALDIEAQHGATWGTYDGRIFFGMAAKFEDSDQMRYLRPLAGDHEMMSFLEDTLLQPGIIVLAHNAKYDLPGIQGEMLRLNLGPLPPLRVIDTCNHIPKNGGMFSKSLANLAQHFGIAQKGSISRHDWEYLYRHVNLWTDPAWDQLREYNENDVEVVLQLRQAEEEAGWLGAPRLWRP